MGYLTDSIQPTKFKSWLYFAVGDIFLNGSILGINSTELMDSLKKIWPNAEIVPGIAAVGLIFALLAGILVLLFKIQFLIEILQTADFAAVLYAFSSFHPSIINLPAGTLIFILVVLFFIVGYLASQLPFIKLVKKSGTNADKIFLFIIVMGSIVFFFAPAASLIFNQ